jgi:Tol biopolymer transport system component
MIDVARGVPQPFTFGDINKIYAVWSPDAKQIAFASYEEGIWNLHQKPSTGEGSEQKLLEPSKSSISRFPCDWSPDGQFLLYISIDPKTGRDLFVLPLNGSERNPVPFANNSFEEQNGQFSPDGQLIAYQSNESGIFEVYVQSFPEPGINVQVSNGGGLQPRWGPDGKELFYITSGGELMAASIEVSKQAVNVGKSVVLFQTQIALGGYMEILRAQYDVSRDGQRFLINNIIGEPSSSPIRIVTNWTSLLKKQ